MTVSAPRLSLRLFGELERLAESSLPAAEIARRLGRRAAELGLAQPSYETVRRLVRAHRRRRREPSTADVLLDVTLRTRPPSALYDLRSPLRGPLQRP